MNGARYQFFPSSAFTQNKHRIGMLAYLFDQPVHSLHLGGNAYQTRKARLRAKLLAKYTILLVHLEQAHYSVELAAQFGDMERLGHVVHSAHARRLNGAFNRSVLR